MKWTDYAQAHVAGGGGAGFREMNGNCVCGCCILLSIVVKSNMGQQADIVAAGG
jgi:hypothetical protein